MDVDFHNYIEPHHQRATPKKSHAEHRACNPGCGVYFAALLGSDSSYTTPSKIPLLDPSVGVVYDWWSPYNFLALEEFWPKTKFSPWFGLGSPRKKRQSPQRAGEYGSRVMREVSKLHFWHRVV